MSNEKSLNSDFIVELAKACLTNAKILEICSQQLKYTYLENEAQKNVFSFIFDTYSVTSTIPSIGIIGQNFSTHQETISLLSQIKKINRVDNNMIILEQLEEHIKKVKFAQLLEESVKLFNNQQKEKAYTYLQEKSIEIANFTFKQNYYTTVFGDYNERMEERRRDAQNENHSLEKCQWGIHGLDESTKGGIKKGTSALVMARSGKGKSMSLRWVGLHNARLGQRVVHFQAEGTKKDCMDLYDAGWTGVLTDNMTLGSIPESQARKIEKTRTDILVRGGDIRVIASETFDSMSIDDAQNILIDIENIHGKIDLIIFDYLEIFTAKGNFSGEAGERRRREVVANKMTNIAVKFDAAVLTATQANDIDPKDYNNPNFVLTRHHISEFKGALKPFSYFVTINQTDEQYQNSQAVLYEDKFRHHKAGKKHPIFQSLERGRFYDSQRTLVELMNVAA